MSSIFMLRSRRSEGDTPRACNGASTFSSTVSQGNNAKLWNTMETLISASAIGLPCQYTCPADGVESPVNILNIVDLPDPDGPSKARISPGTMLKSVAEIT